MDTTADTSPSFSPARKWSLSLNTFLSIVAVVALVGMMNYLAARHFKRFSWSSQAQAELSDTTRRILASVTNEINVTIYFSKRDPLFPMTWNLLKAYRYANDRISVKVVDYETDAAEAQLVKARYQLNDKTQRDMVIFESQGRPKFVNQSELSELDIEPLMTQQSQEIKRTAFKGEPMFTSAILNVISPRQLKACFLAGHHEHDPESVDKVTGYKQFAAVLAENNIQFEKLRLEGPGEIPADCNLLIIPGPRDPLPADVLDKIERYLRQGGRLLMLFNFETVLQPTGLERLLAGWGVAVGKNVVLDERFTVNKQDLVVNEFSGHALIKPFIGSQLYLVLPRSVARSSGTPPGADSPQVEVLAQTSSSGRVFTDIRAGGRIYPMPGDYIGEVPVMVAVEKGGVRNVSADRGATRIVVLGDSFMFGNETIENLANRQFAGHAINWLLARNDYLVALAPRPIKEFKLTMTRSQLAAAQWLLLGAFPGAVLVLGWLVWLKRRR